MLNGESKLNLKKHLLMAVMFFYLFFLFAPPANAQSIADSNSELQQGVRIIEQPLGLPSADVRLIVARIIRVALALLGLIMLILVLYAGFLWMTSGGNEEKVTSAKKILTNATIGLIIILMAYAIVLFVLRLLGLGGAGGGPGVLAPNSYGFQGSGALGQIIKDHYPARDQQNVPRNTKIIITFRRPIKLDSFVKNINGSKDSDGNDLFGDCINIGRNMNWKTDCDALKNIDDNHINITRLDTGQSILGANLLAAYENGKVYTIVIRPYDYLGSTTTPVKYNVRLGKAIQLDDPANNNPSAFNGRAVGNDYYEWGFTVSTDLDLSPPRVDNVFPAPSAVEYKNSVIQIDFTEAVDPIGLQGTFATSGDHYIVGNNFIGLQSKNSGRPSGNFELVNGYRTLEFTPDIECGQNACGGKVFCLPVCDKPGNNCVGDENNPKKDDYKMLAKAAETFSGQTFEAIPFTGVEDLAGNALDSRPYGAVNLATTSGNMFPNWQEPDNYFWGFTLKNAIDLTSPYLQQVSPGLDATFISAYSPWDMLWSKRMRINPFYDLGIEESPTPAERGDNIALCKKPTVFFYANGATLTRLDHCAFLDGRRQYYFPVVSSSIEDAHFNCFYPGLGPGDDNGVGGGNAWTAQGQLHAPISLVCDEGHPLNCCSVTSTPQSRALCCNGLVKQGNVDSVESCVNAIKADSPL